jgi:hypothetical protein
MRAWLICGILLFSGAATAQDRSSCFKNCDAIYYTCYDQCPGTTACHLAATIRKRCLALRHRPCAVVGLLQTIPRCCRRMPTSESTGATLGS